MENKEYILFYDSGVGGLTTLKETMRILPFENYIYFADDINCPYGNKTAKEIEKLVKERLDWLFKSFSIKLVVFACNTITMCCVERLRALYKVKFVGTEPALLPAMKESKTKEVLVIATNATLKQEKFGKLKESVGGNVHLLAFEGLARDIEKHYLQECEIDITKYIEKIKYIIEGNKKIDGLVLGCTHYCFFKDQIKRGVGINVYDGNKGVARRVFSLLKKEENRNCCASKGSLVVITGSGDKKRQENYKDILRKMS